MVSARGILGVVQPHPWPALAGGLAVLAVVVSVSSQARAIDADLDTEGVDSAITFARQATRQDRQAFHAGYIREPGEQVRRISLVSEYRRVVLLVEEKRRVLDRNYGVRQMATLLKPWRGLLEVIVELQFHPHNNYVGVPLIDVLLVPLDDSSAPMPLTPEATDRRPRFGQFWDPPPFDAPWWPFPPPAVPVITGSEPLTGGWLFSRFDARPLARGRYEVVVKDGAVTLGKGEFDVGRLR